ncbi:hypothetical protein [Nostoc sp.]|uniref:hypothetical protein n=1 Tax=Nostoc sp. TaxID=1180 RepID=UPI002FF059C5
MELKTILSLSVEEKKIILKAISDLELEKKLTKDKIRAITAGLPKGLQDIFLDALLEFLGSFIDESGKSQQD